jgi:pathogenesis-related protein 1
MRDFGRDETNRGGYAWLMKRAHAVLLGLVAVTSVATACSSASDGNGFGGDGGGVGDDAGFTLDGGIVLPKADGSPVGTGTGSTLHDGSSGGSPDVGTSTLHDSGSGAPDVGTTSKPDATTSVPDATTPSGDTGVPADESEWLDGQNAARAAVGEAPLVWNSIAAQVAAEWAPMCNWEHNPNRDADYQALGGGTGGLGENIAAGEPSETPQAGVASWVAEGAWFTDTPGGGTCNAPSGEDCGHYTQIVWKATTSVGCAHVTCTTGSPFGDSNPWDFNVCDYAPPGNYVGESPY